MINTYDTELATNLGLVESIVYSKMQAIYERAVINKENFDGKHYLAKIDKHYLNQALPFIDAKQIDVAIKNLKENWLIIIAKEFYSIVPYNEITLIKNTKKSLTRPKLEDVQEFAKELGRVDLATKFFNYYDGMDWHDMTGKTIKNWKAKFHYWCDRDIKQPVQPNKEVL